MSSRNFSGPRLDKYFDDYVYAYEERFEQKAGPLRPVVRSTVEAFLGCGRLYGGFARIQCPGFHCEHILAFSCQTRSFCPSCQAKRSILFAEKLQEQILEPVPHRHFAFSIPKVLRGLFERERPLLSLLSQTAYKSTLTRFQQLFHRKDVRPGLVSSIQTFARLIRKVFEVDPLLCTKCGTEMKIIAVLTEPSVVDRIIRHLQRKSTDTHPAARSPPLMSHLLN